MTQTCFTHSFIGYYRIDTFPPPLWALPAPQNTPLIDVFGPVNSAQITTWRRLQQVQHGNTRHDFKLSPGKNIFKAQFTCVFHRVGVGGGQWWWWWWWRFGGGGLVFIMSHSFTRSEKAGVWESLRPFRRALPSSLMDFIEPEGEERNSVYLKAALWALKCCSVFIPPPLCLLSLRTTKTFDPPRLLCLSRHSPAIFVLHRFLDLTIFFFSERWSSLDPSLLSWLVCRGFFRWESAPVDNVLFEIHAASGTGRMDFFFYILPSACCN